LTRRFGALGRLVAATALDEATALDWAGMLLAGNARRIFRA
jgi:hypothetical protein